MKGASGRLVVVEFLFLFLEIFRFLLVFLFALDLLRLATVLLLDEGVGVPPIGGF